MENMDTRDRIRCSGFRHWEIAKQIGISEATLCVWLRHPLTGSRLERVNQAIEELISSKKVTA